MPNAASSELDRLVEGLHAARPRVWSIVITFFGDAVVPRGGEVWLGTLAALMDRLGVGSGTLGAAMSRLTAEDWLVRTKRGRHSHYRLAEAGREAFDEAAQRIYGTDLATWTGEWTLWAMPEPDPRATSAWLDAGFGALGPGLWLRPEERPARPTPPFPIGAVRLDARVGSGDPAVLAAAAWPIEALERRSEAFVETFGPLGRALERARLPPLEAMCARTLLVHAFRRMVLREPRLPPAALTPSSPRDHARRLVAETYRHLLEASETWLDGHREAGLGAPSASFYERFGGLPGPLDRAPNALRKEP